MKLSFVNIAVISVILGIIISFIPKPIGISENEYLSKFHDASSYVAVRMFGALLFQGHKTPAVELIKSSLNGQLILLTGGNNGIGLETARGLAIRGAKVIIASRNEVKSAHAVKSIAGSVKEIESQGSIEYANLDLSDLDNVSAAVDELLKRYPNKKFTQIIENSAVWPETGHSISKQGYELAFATNVLGHHLLLRKMMEKDMLLENARIVIVTGDIYVTADDCTPHFTYSGKDGTMPYSRSKICVNWLFQQLQERYPKLWVNLVHPGVIDTGLVEAPAALKQLILLDSVKGAQTTLLFATSSSPLLVQGAYYHNTNGLMRLPSQDSYNNRKRAMETWELVEGICKPYFK